MRSLTRIIRLGARMASTHSLSTILTHDAGGRSYDETAIYCRYQWSVCIYISRNIQYTNATMSTPMVSTPTHVGLMPHIAITSTKRTSHMLRAVATRSTMPNHSRATGTYATNTLLRIIWPRRVERAQLKLVTTRYRMRLIVLYHGYGEYFATSTYEYECDEYDARCNSEPGPFC